MPAYVEFKVTVKCEECDETLILKGEQKEGYYGDQYSRSSWEYIDIPDIPSDWKRYGIYQADVTKHLFYCPNHDRP